MLVIEEPRLLDRLPLRGGRQWNLPSNLDPFSGTGDAMIETTPHSPDREKVMKYSLVSAALVAVCALTAAAYVMSRTPETVSTAQSTAKKPVVPEPQPINAENNSNNEADPDKPEAKDAEPLPPAPLVDPKNEHKELNKDKTLLLEMAPDPADKSKKKAVRVLVASEVCLREGPLEVLMCKKNTKEHEAIVRTDIDARFIHAALVAAGAKPGSPVQFVDPKTGDAAYKPASGQKIRVNVHYTLAGKKFTHPAQEWILDQKTKKPMAHEWVFAGSRFVKNPEKPDDPEHYCANNGEVVAISNFVDSMLDLPVEVGKDDTQLNFMAVTKKIPPLLSKVWVILEPEPAKK